MAENKGIVKEKQTNKKTHDGNFHKIIFYKTQHNLGME